MSRVFIGVGHGGMDPGAVANGLRESDVNLAEALALGMELERHGVVVALSRTTDENDPLAEEIAECNAFRPDVAIEVHNNAGGGDGFEVYRQTNRFASPSLKLAKAIERRIKEIGQNSRGTKTRINTAGADYFGWLRQVSCPAVLCEGAFLDNKTDVQSIDTLEEQRTYGIAYAKGVLDYLGIPWQMEKIPTPGYSLQEGFYAKLENAQRALEQARKEGRNVILVETERLI
jgi:N-acetylmuramoyl-L-alanine amidase